jgi:phage shock protein PspC (stress-responsive transcriptional regulator)
MTDTAAPSAPFPASTAHPVADRPGPFGVCAAIAADIGFNPEILRVGLVMLLLWDYRTALTGYAGMALVVLVSRLLYPARRARMRPIARARALIRRRTPLHARRVARRDRRQADRPATPIAA